MDEFAFNLLRDGILSVREGDLQRARLTLDRVTNLASDPSILADAWYWLSETCQDPLEKRRMLETSLANDLNHAGSRRSLALLDGKLAKKEMIDPDHLPPGPTSSSQPVATQRFTCPNCGGRMSYSPDGRSLECESCKRDLTFSAKASPQEQDFIIAMATVRGHRQPTLVTTFKCQGCGADFLLAPGVISVNCSYCDSPHVVASKDRRELMEPDAILPITIQQSQAAEALAKWIQKQHLQPDEPVQPRHGLYLPVWSFVIGGQIVWSGDKVKNKKKIHVNGEDVVSFNDLHVPASRLLASLLEKMLADQPQAEAPAYDPRYLSGWPVEVYQVPLADASLKARQKAAQRVVSEIRSRDGQLDNLKYSTAGLHVESFQLILVPAWVADLRVHSRSYRVLIHGQNGKIQSEFPERGLAGWLNGLLDH